MNRFTKKKAKEVWVRIFLLPPKTKVKVVEDTLRHPKDNKLHVGRIGWVVREVEEEWKRYMLYECELNLKMDDVLYAVTFQKDYWTTTKTRSCHALKAKDLEVVIK